MPTASDLIRATLRLDVARVRALLDAGADAAATNHEGLGALHYAAGEGSSESAAALLRAGADVNAQARDGRTPLHVLVDQEPGAPVGGVVRLLLASGADLTLRDAAGRTAPEVAALHGYPADFLERGS